MIRKHQYAIYIAPRQCPKYLMNGNPLWNGIHITMVGFEYDHPEIKKTLLKLSTSARGKQWNPCTSKMTMKNYGEETLVYIPSKTLNTICSSLLHHGFRKVKQNFHITIVTENVPCNIDLHSAIGAITEWDYVVVRRNKNNNIEWLERYPVHMFS